MSKKVIITVNSAESLIKVFGLDTDELVIDFSEDVHFTELISSLTNLINTEESIDYEIGEYDTDDKKLIIIINTIKSIFDKYSESIALSDEDDEDDLPF